MSWEHAAEAREALNAIVSDPQHGVAALSSAQTMSNLLKDLLPDAPREKSILVAAAEAGLASTLRDHVDQGMDASTAIRLTASSFSSTTPFTPEACSWVTGEIAGALGISQPGSPGGAFGGGAFGGTPGGFDPIGGQGAPTQMAPIPGYTPGQVPTQGLPATPGQGGFGQAGGFDPGATAPGAWQAGGGFGQGTGQPAGGGFGQGTGQPAGGGFGQGTGQPAGGFGQGTGGAGQPTTAWQPGQAGYGPTGTGQPAGGAWQPGQQGFGQGGVQPAQGGWQPAGGGFGQGPGFGPGGIGGGQQRSKRGLFIGIGIAVVVVVIILAVALSGGKPPTPTPTHTPIAVNSSPPVTTPSTTPPTNPSGVEALTTIMTDPGSPVGTECSSNPPLFGLNGATVISRRFCAKTTTTDVIVWGYQFDSYSDYLTGFKHIKDFTGFNNETPGTGCPPSSGSSEGTTGWHAINNPRYPSHAGQDLDCFMNGKQPRPTLIWSMPTQHVFFIAKDTSATSSLKTIVNWWDDVAYAP